jgi:tetratricopeptide (TPR) repeat protein
LSFVFLPAIGQAQHWHFDHHSLKAYNLALNLQIKEALELVADPKSPQEHYVASLAQTLELLITEDGEKFTEYERAFKSRLERKLTSSPEEYFLQAEIHLQWAFVYLKFGHEFDAALNIRQAYQIVQDCKKDHPQYIAIKKTSGLLDIIIGSIPEKYEWVLGLLGMHGSVDYGFQELESVELADTHLGFEAELVHALIQGFVLQKTAVGVNEIGKILEKHPDNKLVLFLTASLAIKNSQSEEALTMLNKITSIQNGLPIYYSYYLMGEVYLHKGDYLNSITSYHWFIKHYKGQNYLKDAHFKIGICYLLNGNTNDTQVTFNLAKNIGKESTEADKYAARSVVSSEYPNIKLAKARYSTDGGYYSEAAKVLESIAPADIPTKRDQAEYYYRKARLSHKTNQLSAAKLFYKQVLDMHGDEEWYFAPNACLQLGYLAMDEQDFKTAREYFERALTYKDHEYKNSIDSKAKSALGHLNKLK